jgi:2,3-bisphosphoglycerate-independent phosphoglycerate mutase
MDREGNWEKTEKAYDLFVNGKGGEFESISDYIKSQYQKDISDDSIEPGLNKLEKEISRIKDNDAVIFFNFRGDSPRQLTQMFLDKMKSLLFVTMTEYDKNFPCLSAFKSANIETPLAKIISEAGLTQLHIAETEKYAHITYFLNGGQETPFEKEERILVPSLGISSYEEMPEMSAQKITEAIIANLSKYDFIVVNFANADIVGHTGNLEATTKAIEIIDECIGKILTKVLELNGALVITADHGNAEEKIYRLTGAKKTKHSLNPVPFFLISNDVKRKKPLEEKEIEKEYKQIKGTLTDVAPTILELLGLEKPSTMTGSSLLIKL